MVPIQLWSRSEPHDKQADADLLLCLENLRLSFSVTAALQLFPKLHCAPPYFALAPMPDPRSIGEGSAQLAGLLVTVATMLNTKPGELRCAVPGQVWASGSLAVGDGWLQDLPLNDATRAKIRAFYAAPNAQVLLLPANATSVAHELASAAGVAVTCLRVDEFDERALNHAFWQLPEARRVVVCLKRGPDDLHRLAATLLGVVPAEDEPPARVGRVETATVDVQVTNPAPVTIPVTVDVTRSDAAADLRVEPKPDARVRAGSGTVNDGNRADGRAKPNDDTKPPEKSDEVRSPTIAGQVAAWMQFTRYVAVGALMLAAMAIVAWWDPNTRPQVMESIASAREFFRESGPPPPTADATIGLASPAAFRRHECAAATLELRGPLATAPSEGSRLLGVATGREDGWAPFALFVADEVPSVGGRIAPTTLTGCALAVGHFAETDPTPPAIQVAMAFLNARPPAMDEGWIPAMLAELEAESGLMVIRSSTGLPPLGDALYSVRPFAANSMPVQDVGMAWTYGAINDGLNGRYNAIRLEFEAAAVSPGLTYLMQPLVGLSDGDEQSRCADISFIRTMMSESCADLTVGSAADLCGTLQSRLVERARHCGDAGTLD